MKSTILILFTFGFLSAGCQTITINGKIINEQGQPVQGATIRIKYSNIWVTTDINGLFTFHVSRLTDTLIVSAIGYESIEEPNNVRGQITIMLKKKINELKEVVVNTGYQEFIKRSSTGSFDKIDNNSFTRIVSTDILSRLDGIASSTYFSKNIGSQGIYIRGLSTLRAGATSPLIILDNFPYEGDIRNLDPNQVESITILKDAAASSIWGAKAGNGVIVITTKKANYNQPVSVTLNYNISMQEQTDLFKDKNFIEAPAFIETERFLFGKGFYDGTLNNTTSRPVVSPVVEILAKQRSGQIPAIDADAMINALSKYDLRYDMMEYLRRNPVTSQYSLGVSGGASNISYAFMLTYDNTMPEIKGDRSQRAMLNSQLSFRPVRNIEIQTSLNYTYRDNDNNGINTISAGGTKSVLYPYAQLADDYGNSLATPKDYRMAYIDTAGAGLLLNWKYKPMDELTLSDNSVITKALLLKLNIRYSFLRHFVFIINTQLQNDGQQIRSHNSSATYYARNLVNRYSQRTGSTIKKNIPLGGILDNTFNQTAGYAFRTQLNYSNTWNNVYRLDAIGGFESRETHNTANSYRVYGYSDDILTFSNVDFANSYQLYGNLGNAAIPNFQDFTDLTNRFISLYTNASFSFHNRYTFSASARKDASNLFGVNTNQKWTPLWSAAAAWKLSDEKFYKCSWLSLLNLRISYGFNGNSDNTVPSLPVITYRTGVAPTNLPYASIATAWNPDLRWEKVRTINTGLDFELKNQRLSGSIEYYLKNASDLLAAAPVDPTLGIPGNVVTKNVAKLSGHGVDLKLNARIIDASIKFDAMVLFNYVTNKVAEWYNESAAKGTYAGYGYTITPIKGKDPYALISYNFIGLDPQTGDPVGMINDTLSKNYFALNNTPSWNDMIIGGTTRPPFFGSILPSLSWKGFTLTMNIGYRFGYYFRRGTISYSSFYNSWAGNMDFYNRWISPGDEKFTTVPSMSYPANSSRDAFYQYSTATVEKGAHIRLQDLSLNWQKENVKLGSLKIKKISLYSYINNIGIIRRANLAGLDPDYGNSQPPPTGFSFGSKINF